MTCNWGTAKLDKGVYRVWLEFLPLSSQRLWIGTVEGKGRRWFPYGLGRHAEYPVRMTRSSAAYALVAVYLNFKTQEQRAVLPDPYTDNAIRHDLCLTVEQAHKVWDVLVEKFDAREIGRRSFVYHVTTTGPTSEWSCGWGKFRQGHYSFGVSQHSEDVTPWSEYILTNTGLALQELYTEFFGQRV